MTPRLVFRGLLGWMVLATQLIAAPAAQATEQLGAGPTVHDAPPSACDSLGAPTMSVYLPNITKTLGGAAGWDTPFYIQNAGAIQTTIEVSFFRFSDGALVTCRKSVGVAPGTSLLDDPNADADLPNDSQFSAVVKSYGAPVVATVNQSQGTGATTEALSYSGFSTGATKVYLPNVTRRFYGYDVPFIIQNLGSLPTVVNARFVSFDGAQTFQTSLSIAPGRSGVVDPDFTPGLIDGTQYAVTLTSAEPIAVVVNAHDELIGPVAFSHNGLTGGGTTLYAPYAAKVPNGMFSPVVVQNVGTTTADATLTFLSLSGAGAPQTFTLTAIPAGGSRAFDPRFDLGTITPCLIAGPTCLGPGEFSLKIQSTSPVAAVVLPNSPSTAAGYLAAAELQPRSLLPVVMRAFGGPSGWTTFIYVQAAVAAQATVRYYSLGTGALITTQSVAITNGTTKIDPRAVPGLQDNAQYAVTIDGNGAVLTAIAHELSAAGGDGSMIYEGFAGPSLPAAPQAASLRLQPASASVAAGATQQFTAAVNDQFGSPFAGAALAWTIVPATLGSISPTGSFTAGQQSGVGVVTVTTVGMTASATVSVQGATSAVIGGITFRIASTANADFYAESAISDADTQTLAGLVEPAIAFIQADFGRTFTSRPEIYAFASTSSVTAGWTSVLGASGVAGTGFAGVFISSTSRIGLNWETMKLSLPYRSVRHELVHKMEQQLTGNRLFPMWFNEGVARFEDLTVPGGAYRIVESRYGVASMAMTGTLLNVMTLSDDQFQSLTGVRGSYSYYEAAETYRLMRADLTQAGIVRLLEAVGAGQTFEGAYASVSGQPLSSFAATRYGRLLAFAPSPGITTAPDTIAGPGLAIEAYGLAPLASVTLTITGQTGGSGPLPGTANEFGVVRSFLGSTWPLGTYTISVQSGLTTLTTVAAKTTSLTAATDSVVTDGRYQLLVPDLSWDTGRE